MGTGDLEWDERGGRLGLDRGILDGLQVRSTVYLEARPGVGGRRG